MLFFLQEIHQSKTYDNGCPNGYESRNHKTVVQNPGTGFCSSISVKINRGQIAWIKTKEEMRLRSRNTSDKSMNRNSQRNSQRHDNQ